jgi:carboxylesterase type B
MSARLCFVLLCLLQLVALLIGTDTSIVTTPLGQVKGNDFRDHREFLNLPYAIPPVGKLRWTSPQAHPAWTNILDATAFGPGCQQDCVLPPNSCPLTLSEDCLQLNVFTPKLEFIEEHGGKLPVMVFFPGGRYEQGGASTQLYNGTFLANSTGVILVTSNYRLGAFGFLRVKDTFSGQFGIEDQQAALRWVQQNIASFGGDPSQVTIFGQSAGATSTTVHLCMPSSSGLFHRAIIESNPISLPLKTVDEAEKMGSYFAEDSKCKEDDLACWQSLSVETILSSQKNATKHIPYLKPLQLFLPFTPVVDGSTLKDQPLRMLQKGEWINKVPVILGSVGNEALLFIYQAATASLSKTEYEEAILAVFHTASYDVLKQYPAKSVTGDHRDLMAKLGTEYMFFCAGRNALQSMATQVPVYFYRFTHLPSMNFWGPGYPMCNPLVHDVICHGTELPFLFNTTSLPPGNFEPTEAEVALSDAMMLYWGGFAWSSDPNHFSPAVRWNPFMGDDMTMLNLNTPPVMQNGTLEDNCAFWDKEGYDWP